MITLYTGTPGSGKSFHATRDIVSRLKRGGGIICNFPINQDMIKKRKTRVDYWDNSDMTVQRFIDYARDNHKFGKEGQTLVIIDECQLMFNCRDFGRKDRSDWIRFFSLHRKLGFNFILISQSDRFIDKQIRGLIENEVRHRKLNNYGFGGLLLSLTFTAWFIAIDYWYGGNKLLIGKQIFKYRKKYEKIYDTYRMFQDMASTPQAQDGGGAGGDREAVAAPGEAVALEPHDVEPFGDNEDNEIREQSGSNQRRKIRIANLKRRSILELLRDVWKVIKRVAAMQIHILPKHHFKKKAPATAGDGREAAN